MMKYLLVLVVVGVVVWMLTARARPPGGGRGDAGGGRRGPGTPKAPQAMLSCAHCGVHLPAADAVLDGSRVFCSEAHRSAGPRTG